MSEKIEVAIRTKALEAALKIAAPQDRPDTVLGYADEFAKWLRTGEKNTPAAVPHAQRTPVAARASVSR